jgi:hypothetical protein
MHNRESLSGYGENDPEWIAEQERLRRRRAVHFARLVKRLDLLSFSDIADWCARLPGGFSRDENRRAAAYRDLEQAVLDGEFPRRLATALRQIIGETRS